MILGQVSLFCARRTHVSHKVSKELAGTGGMKSHAVLHPGDQLCERGCPVCSELSVSPKSF